MARNSKISWTGSTWNPIRGCDPISPGCKNCYAIRIAHRYKWGKGLTVIRSGRPAWSGQIHLVPDKLDEPLRWREPQRVFPCSGADLFHDAVPFEHLAAMYGVMLAARRHTFQVLTKRPERRAEFMRWLVPQFGHRGPWAVLREHALAAGVPARLLPIEWTGPLMAWPAPNIWEGVSVESTPYLSRIDALAEHRPAVLWVSAEPLLERVDFGPHLAKIDWLVVGGESGHPGRDCRPCAMEWIAEIKDACLRAGVPVFVKQLGSWVVSEERMADTVAEASELFGYEVDHPWLWAAGLRDVKGEDPQEWPEDMRVRLFPGDPLPRVKPPPVHDHPELPPA